MVTTADMPRLETIAPLSDDPIGGLSAVIPDHSRRRRAFHAREFVAAERQPGTSFTESRSAFARGNVKLKIVPPSGLGSAHIFP